MKNINIGNIRPIAEPRPAEKPSRKGPASGLSFSETLETAVSQMNKATRTSGVDAQRIDTHSIQQEYTAANEQYVQLMRAKENLNQLHQMIINKSSERS